MVETERVRRRALVVLSVVFVLIVLATTFNHASARVAFMGDSITQGWTFPRANLGIYGQTTEQMLERFPGQVARPSNGVQFREVVIAGGTNDTLLHLDPQVTLNNLARMVDLARAAGVEPILAEIPPILRNGGAYEGAVVALNAGIVELAQRKGVRIVDYFDALEGHESAFTDGVHLRHRGYFRMEWALLRTGAPILF